MEENKSIMRNGVASPDADYADVATIPQKWLPKSLRPYSTSIVKWEHILPDDMPKPIEKILIRVNKELLHKELMYADKTIPLWYNEAVKLWKAGEKDSALYKIARCCHLIEDITVPMHCKVSSVIIDAWQSLNHIEANHKKFERLCGIRYVPNSHKYKIKIIKDLEKESHKIASKSRKIYKLCDEVGSTKLTKNPLTSWVTFLLPWLKEDYDKAIIMSYRRGEEYTVRLLYTFFKEINE